MVNPLEAIRDWHKSLPRKVAGLVAERLILSLDKDLGEFPDSETAIKRFDTWLLGYGDNPLAIVAKAGMFRTIFEVALGDSFDPDTWHDRRRLMEEFVDEHPNAETTRKLLQEHEFESAQWRVQEDAWRQLVADQLCDGALRFYYDGTFRNEPKNSEHDEV